MKTLLRGWMFVAFVAVALPILESCTGQALAPTPFAPLPDFQTNGNHARCASGSLQPGWIFGGACADLSVKTSGAKLGLPPYEGYAVHLQIPHNDVAHKAKLRIVDATGDGDIRPDKGKNFPLYANAFLYFKVVNTEKEIGFSKGSSVSFEIVTASAVLGSPCTIAFLKVKKGKSAWQKLPVGGKLNGKDLTFDVPSKDDPNVPKGEQYFAFACQTSPTPTPSATPTPGKTPFPSPSPTGNIVCNAPSLGFGTYTSIVTVGNAAGHTYTQTSGSYTVDMYSPATPTPKPTPTPTPTPSPHPTPTPTPGPTPTPVMITVYYGEYSVQSFSGTNFMLKPFTAAATLGCFQMILVQPPGGTIGQLRFRSSAMPKVTSSNNAFGDGSPPTNPSDNVTLQTVGTISSLSIDNLTTTTGNGTLTLDNSAKGTITLTGSLTVTVDSVSALLHGRRFLKLP